MIEAFARLIAPALEHAAAHGKPRLLLSAHGLPKRVIQRGDPYQAQVEATAAAVIARLARRGLDWLVCYQSRVGPLEWIGPYAEAEIDRAGRDRVPVVMAPIAFVSEHSETLVELDMLYRDRALATGAPAYVRVPALGTDRGFIGGLAALARAAGGDIAGSGGGCHCPAGLAGCAMR